MSSLQDSRVRKICLLLILISTMFILLQLLMTFRKFDSDTYGQRIDLSQKYLRPGLNIDNLPLVKVDYGAYVPQQKVGGSDENSDDDGDDNGGNGNNDTSGTDDKDKINDKNAIANVRQACLTRGYYLGEENEYQDCAAVCHVSSEDVVSYAYLENTANVIGGRKKLKSGAWCLPTKAASCNTNTAIVVYSLNGWTCLPTSDAFSGEGGNRIAVCDGTLYDNALKVRYKNFIPANLTFTNLYEDKLSDGRYRFTCPSDLTDDIRNHYLESPYNRFHLLRNWCLSDVPFGRRTSQPDSEFTQCFCDDPMYADPSSGKCTACKPKFDTLKMTVQLASRPCYSMSDYVEYLANIRDRLKYPSREIVLPCGFTDDTNSNSEVTRPRCTNAEIMAFKPMLPSSNTLKYIRDVIG